MKVGLFPGQGIPARKVLEALSGAEEELVLAGDVLGFDLERRVEVAARGKGNVLRTSVAQPAIFLAGVHQWRLLHTQGARYDCFAGHSLGEYAALVASDSMSLEGGLAAVTARGKAMHEAAKASRGGMVAVMKLDDEQAAQLAQEQGAALANDNAPGQVVLSGAESCLTAIAARVSECGGRSVLLEVEGAFHTEAMRPAAPQLAAALQEIAIEMPSVPVVSNVTARPYESVEEIRTLLVRQLTERVRWRESLEWLWRENVREYEDLGPGTVVAKLAQRTWHALEQEEASAHV